ncbi:hypothetical protein B0T26DRAFT_756432 [Lasiosphaeria miniovina]|uniref:Uncharacterized protein n=1 Tax=Lasiosphaeria miniovina TaxID=1954250 RepID=A0AA40DKH4_9PEZI|nr:uncharacterized protein B0T26DRAFT_756432 [Lasiosphaeria miniovina]KAK0707029.1 hypothetical protein B0T26DRAFT_756432 [Lasiosphaeria miniovina]
MNLLHPNSLALDVASLQGFEPTLHEYDALLKALGAGAWFRDFDRRLAAQIRHG